MFLTDDEIKVRRSAAATFVEINANQTRIAKAHIDEIGYSILGKTDSRYLAAEVFLRLNRRVDGPLQNLLRTAFHKEGHIPLTTVTTALAKLTNLAQLSRLSKSRRGRGANRWVGLKNLLGLTALDLSNHDEFVKKIEIALDRYYKAIRKRFVKDWESIPDAENTTLGFAVVQAALIALFDHCINLGLDWSALDVRLDILKNHLEKSAGAVAAKVCVFRPTDPNLPSQKKKVKENLTFLITHTSASGDS